MFIHDFHDHLSRLRLMMQSSATPSRLTSFYPFSRLPSEIQIKIYQEIASSARVVNIRSRRIAVPQDWAVKGIPYNEVAWMNDFICNDPVPVALHICHTSRQEAKDIYTRAFRSQLNLGISAAPKITVNESYFWVNWELDTLQLSSQFTLQDIIDEEQAQIRNLKLPVLYNNVSFETEFTKLLTPLKKLQHLDVLSDVDLEGWDGRLDVIWAIFEDLFGKTNDWNHPHVRIVADEAGNVMTYLNEERWHMRFASRWYEAHFSNLNHSSADVGSTRDERFVSFGKTYRWGRDRRRPIDPMEESVVLDCQDYGRSA